MTRKIVNRSTFLCYIMLTNFMKLLAPMCTSCFASGCWFTGAVRDKVLWELPRHLLKLQVTKRVTSWWSGSVTWVSRKSGNSERKLRPCVHWEGDLA